MCEIDLAMSRPFRAVCPLSEGLTATSLGLDGFSKATFFKPRQFSGSFPLSFPFSAGATVFLGYDISLTYRVGYGIWAPSTFFVPVSPLLPFA